MSGTKLLLRLWVGDGVTQMQLCEHLKCEPPTVTNMVKSLEQMDLYSVNVMNEMQGLCEFI